MNLITHDHLARPVLFLPQCTQILDFSFASPLDLKFEVLELFLMTKDEILFAKLVIFFVFFCVGICESKRLFTCFLRLIRWL
jgi:hypothetical protein